MDMMRKSILVMCAIAFTFIAQTIFGVEVWVRYNVMPDYWVMVSDLEHGDTAFYRIRLDGLLWVEHSADLVSWRGTLGFNAEDVAEIKLVP